MAVSQESSIVSHGDIDSSATETYGGGPVILRIGNGGAGATGLLQALAEDYLTTRPETGSIEWVCNHSRNTQLALLHGYVDIALTYERDQEALAAEEGWSKTVGCIFHDHFVLAGPVSDPAAIKNAASLRQALESIAANKSLFHSRADASATMWKERSLWHDCQIEPWSDSSAAIWYKQSQLSPAGALVAATEAGAYLLTDRSTLLRQTGLQSVREVTVFFEPESKDSRLMNSCHALVSSCAGTGNERERDRFLGYLVSARGQQVISSFDRDRLGGFPLFAGVAEGFARSFLQGGEPVDGAWKVDPGLHSN